MAGEPDISSSSPNKRRKTLNSKFEFEIGEDPTPYRPQEAEDSSSESCAVCYLDDGKAIRGQIDCCDHHFCFLCIMEWSKTESRCPLCRRRFHTIRRPPKEGVLRERVVKVPVRDQASFGNTTGVAHSYEETRCTVCQSSTDEYLLLLCDLCDSAAHTYCIGLGNTVPEGDWFCHDCTASRPENHSNFYSQEDEDTPFGYWLRITRNLNQSSGPTPPPVVPDRCTIIRDEVTTRTPPSVANRPTESVARVVDEVTTPARRPPSVASRGTESIARTLDRCRNSHSHIQSLRRNWNGFQSGSLSFRNGVVFHERSSQAQSSSSSSYQQVENRDSCGSHDAEKAWKMMDIARSGSSSSKKGNNGVVFHERSGQTQSSSSSSCQQMENRDSSDSYDVDKAWKMMDIARRHAQKKCSNAVQSPKVPPSRTNANSGFGTSGQAKSSSSTGCPQPTNQVGCGSHNIDKASKIINTTKSKLVHRNDTSSSSASKEATNVNRSTLSQTNCVIGDRTRSGPSINEGTTGKARKDDDEDDDDAKSEIRSLVKINLKLLSKDKPLGYKAFKEIARLSTHTILAACGLEHPKSGMPCFPSLVCCHNKQFQLSYKSSLTPPSCRACFDGFVKDVVSGILFDSAASAKLS